MLGLFLMYISIVFPKTLGWMFFLGYPIATGSGFINQNSLYSFMWLLPENANFINGIAMGTQALSDMLALVAVFLNDEFGLPISYSLLGLCVLNVFAAITLQIFVPAKRYYLDIGRELVANAKGVSVPPPAIEESTCMKVYRSIQEACSHPILITLMMVFSSVYFLSTILPVEYMLYYYEDLWPSTIPSTTNPSKIVTFLVNTYAIVYGLGGFVSSILGGALCDQLGIRYFTLLVGFSALASGLLLLAKSENIQVAAEIMMTFGGNLYGIVIIRFSMLYASPELFGCLSGTLYTLLTFGMLFLYAVLSFIMDVVNVNSAKKSYQIQFVILGVLSTVLSLALMEYWRVHPPPDVIMGEKAAADHDVISSSADIELLPIMIISKESSSPTNERSELLCSNQSSAIRQGTACCSR